MSKELTEQWRNGTIKFGYYYVKNRDGQVFTMAISGGFIDENLFQRIVEVLAPVPTYNEYLESESHCAVYSEVNQWNKEKIDELVKQLKEANEVIKWYDGLENILIGWEICTGQPKGTANDYLEKWGVE